MHLNGYQNGISWLAKNKHDIAARKFLKEKQLFF